MSAALALSVLLSGAAQETPAPQAAPVIRWEKSFEEALKKARRLDKPLIVDFWADWCDWCHRLESTTYADPAVARQAQDFVAVRVDTEGSRKEQAVAKRYRVSNLPTIAFLSPEGREVHRVNGFQGPGQFPFTLDAARQAARWVAGWEDALRRNPDDPRALVALGTHSYEREYFDEARDLLRRAIPRDAEAAPEDRRRARMLLAIIEHVTRNFEEAEKLVREALALPPDPDEQPKLLFVLGRTQVSSGRQAEGLATLEVIVREYPQSPVAQKARETLTTLKRR